MMTSTVTELKRDRTVVEPVAVFLRAIDPSIPVTPQVVRVILESKSESILIDLLTNNGSFWFLQQTIEQNFDRRFRIAESF